MSKKKEERQLQIRQILEEKEKIKVAELAKLLSVTPETLRKDLASSATFIFSFSSRI